ncbi:MAG TPA: hypothetical protein P5307_12545, partial [Pirellulaceae bacterium]|nr:hypothetical protein [Pirellulaceae bacterium]
MDQSKRRASRILGVMIGVAWLSFVTERSSLAERPKTGIETRSPWTTSRILGSPEPPLPYVTERVFPGLQFN